MKIKAVIFDFFGVICSEVAPLWLGRHFSPEKSSEIKAAIVHSADTGEISQDEMFRKIAALVSGYPAQIEAEWHSIAMIDQDVVSLLASLDNEYAIALVTNSPGPFVRKILATNELSHFFDVTIVSSEVGFAKPRAECYEAALHKLSVTPNQAVMIDDNPVNINGAQELGMRGILFQSADSLRAQLANMGVACRISKQN